MPDSSPRILLLHGAGLGSWIWDRVIPELTATAEAVDLPGRGKAGQPGDVTLGQCIDFVADKARPSSILVGHSFSAEIAIGVAVARPEAVEALILVSGMVPESGKSFMSLLPLPQRLLLHVLLRLNRKGIALPSSLVEKEYCNDLDDATTKRVLTGTVPEAPRLYLDSLEWSALPNRTPRFYVKLLNDRSVTPAQQDAMIDRIRATAVASMDTGHLPMLAQPRQMAATLNRLVASI